MIIMVIQDSSLDKGLPKKTLSLCPECKKKIKAKIVREDGKAVMKKDCPEHGHFESVIWSDVDMYLKAEKWAFDGTGIDNPKITDATSCPENCGLCNLHKSHTSLANVDLTNRCNMNCPICFANANAAGYVYEPSFDKIVDMLQNLRDEKPVPTPAVQLAGGEPTVYPRFFDVVETASNMGFAQVQVATNGVKLAQSEDYAQKCVDAGLHTVYLQFDGLDEDIYRQARGREMMEIKNKVIENCRKTKPKPLATVLVPTMLKGVNDDQVGDIMDYAIENRDVIRGVNFQPVAFTGRIEKEKRKKQRYTLSDMAIDLEKETDYLSRDDFYPVPFVTPISQLISIVKGEPQVAFTSHPHCGLASYLVIGDDGDIKPITKFADVEGLIGAMHEKAGEWNNTLHKALFKVGGKVGKLKSDKGKKKTLVKKFQKLFGNYIKDEELPGGMTLGEMMTSIISQGDKAAVGDFSWRTMFVGGMHFQDLYNYDIERVKRCVIHYATPDDRIIPFCAYNGGPTYREEVEKEFSVPLDEWRKRNEA
ncbi:MAG: radical SAM protein [Candidatus Saliniplasma sp.]